MGSGQVKTTFGMEHLDSGVPVDYYTNPFVFAIYNSIKRFIKIKATREDPVAAAMRYDSALQPFHDKTSKEMVQRVQVPST